MEKIICCELVSLHLFIFLPPFILLLLGNIQHIANSFACRSIYFQGMVCVGGDGVRWPWGKSVQTSSIHIGCNNKFTFQMASAGMCLSSHTKILRLFNARLRSRQGCNERNEIRILVLWQCCQTKEAFCHFNTELLLYSSENPTFFSLGLWQ